MNRELLSKTMDYINEHPEEHDQSWWGLGTACGTTMCFAGHAIKQGGGQLLWADGSEDLVVGAIGPYGEKGSPGMIAEQMLELAPKEATDLFDGSTSLEDVRAVVQRLLDSEVPTP